MADALFLSGDQVPDYFKGVELISAGRKWLACTGEHTITSEHLRDAARAANEDPHIQPPRIRLGHFSKVNDDEPQWDPFAALGDAAPAFGTFTNLRVVNDGAVLVADVDRIVTWLAMSAPATYPNRSSEALFEVVAPQFDVQTNGGERYQMVLSGVAFLGVELPAIADLEDLSTLITSGPAAVAAKRAGALSMPDMLVAPEAASALSISIDTLWMRSWEWLDGDNDIEADTRYWWPREVRVDGDGSLWLAIDDNSGHLFRADIDTDGEDDVSFELKERVRDELLPVAAKARVLASFARPPSPVEPSRPSPAASTAATERPNTEGGPSMGEDIRDILVGLGLDPETANEQQVAMATELAQARSAAQPPANEPTDPPEAEADDDAPEAEADDAAADRTPEPVAASRPDPHDAAKDQALASLSAEVEQLRKWRSDTLAAQTKDRRDGKIAAAVQAGKITPAEREHYRALADVDEDRTDALLSALPANRVPLDQQSIAPDPEGDAFAADQPLPVGLSLLNPNERATVAARRAA